MRTHKHNLLISLPFCGFSAATNRVNLTPKLLCLNVNEEEESSSNYNRLFILSSLKLDGGPISVLQRHLSLVA